MKEPYKILIVTAMYGRPLVSELFALQLERLKKFGGKIFSIDCLAAVSESASEDVCKKYSIDYQYIKNEPLSNKWNAITEYAVRHRTFDYILMLGDDDIISNKLLQEYL